MNNVPGEFRRSGFGGEFLRFAEALDEHFADAKLSVFRGRVFFDVQADFPF